jgi:hypothetical protein
MCAIDVVCTIKVSKEDAMDAERALWRLLIGAVALFGALIAVGVVTAPDDAAGGRSSTAVVSSYSHDELQPAADMTQQMSSPNANTGSQHHTRDEQLERSRSVGYVRALERHQADIDRMLARSTP